MWKIWPRKQFVGECRVERFHDLQRTKLITSRHVLDLMPFLGEACAWLDAHFVSFPEELEQTELLVQKLLHQLSLYGKTSANSSMLLLVQHELSGSISPEAFASLVRFFKARLAFEQLLISTRPTPQSEDSSEIPSGMWEAHRSQTSPIALIESDNSAVTWTDVRIAAALAAHRQRLEIARKQRCREKRSQPSNWS